MIHRLLLSTLGLITLANCQSKTDMSSANSSSTTEIKSGGSSTSQSTNNPEKEAEMSAGLPPDAEAIRIAEEEAKMGDMTQGEKVYFKEGENKFIKAAKMNITFKAITQDSRCPVDVQCIWSGVATAQIEVMGESTRPVTLKLNTINSENRGYSTSQNFNGYTITLVDLSPETTSEKGYKTLIGKYKIGLQIKKTGATDNGSPSGSTTK